MLIVKALEEIEKKRKLPLLQAAAASGNKEAKFNIGYYNAIGLKPNYKEAIRIFEKFAKENDPDAQHNLGVMYFFGYGVEQNTEKALHYIKKAAEQGCIEDKILIKKLEGGMPAKN